MSEEGGPEGEEIGAIAEQAAAQQTKKLDSRRDFLKKAIVIGATPFVAPAAAAFGIGAETVAAAKAVVETKKQVEQVVTPEIEPVNTPLTVFIDFDSNDLRPILERGLGAGNVPTNAENLNFSNLNTEEIVSILKSGNVNNIQALLINGLFQEKRGHGDLTTGVFRNFVESQQITGMGRPDVLPVLDATRTEFLPQSNPNEFVASLTVDENRIGDMLEQHFHQHPEQQIVNFSGMVGRMERTIITRGEPRNLLAAVTEPNPVPGQPPWRVRGNIDNYNYGAKPIEGKGNIGWPYLTDPATGEERFLEVMSEADYLRRNEEYQQNILNEYQQTGRSEGIFRENYDIQTTEAYSPEFARENLTRLGNLCDRFPDKLFVVSGGNEGNYFYEVRQQMEAEGIWPENLIMVGVEDSLSEHVEADGADIYIRRSEYNFQTGNSTSEAAAMISAAVDRFVRLNPGMTPEQIKQTFLEQYSEQGNYTGINGQTGEEVSRTGRFLLNQSQIPGGFIQGRG